MSNKKRLTPSSTIYHIPPTNSAFTIVELLVVIVIIGILAAITIVSYTGISQKATTSALKADLAVASQKLKMYYTLYESYPTALNESNCPTAPEPDNKYCLPNSDGNELTYSSVAPSIFHLTNTKGNTTYSATDSSGPTIAMTSSTEANGNFCPTGYIAVPGSGTYGTNDFCVMKYEAKIQGNDVGNQTYDSAFVPESRMTGTPWVNISQTNAIAEAATACDGCHLISEAEWMTIAQNVLSVSSNWSGGTVGSGYIFSGHNDGSPSGPQAAAADVYPYNNTGQSSPSNQKRALNLTNGEVIWDMSGNVWEWTDATIAPGQQPGMMGDSLYIWRQWNDVSLLMNGLPAASQPGSTGLSGVTWNSSAGVGQLFSKYGDLGTARSFIRGGYWNDGVNAGVLLLNLNYNYTNLNSRFGFRVSR
jgi:prepilin-type N-terminal cleavage/methylation domain-containing protein